MKIINNGLEVVIGTWSDPGDYPSGAGSGPLEDHQQVEDISGSVEIEIEVGDASEVVKEDESVFDHIDNMVINHLMGNEFEEEVNESCGFRGINFSKWIIVKTLGNNKYEVKPTEFEDRDYEGDGYDGYDA